MEYLIIFLFPFVWLYFKTPFAHKNRTRSEAAKSIRFPSAWIWI